MTEVENNLRHRMLAAAQICKKELRWNPSRAVQMINEHGPIEAARLMVLAPNGTDGFARCWEENRLELSVEHIVLELEFAPLFTSEVLDTARNRLEQARTNLPRGT
jgi:hypothetical protein